MAQGNELTLGDMLRELYGARLFLFAGALAGTVLAVGVMVFAVPHYRAAMLLAPASETMAGSAASLPGQYDLSGMQYVVHRPGALESADFTRFEHILTGPSVAAILFEDPRIRTMVGTDVAFTFLPESAIASPAALSEYLQESVRIRPVGSTALRRVEYSHPDPAFAAFLPEALRAATDELIRREVRAQTERRIAYLLDQTDKIVHPQHRQVLTSLLMEQEQMRMMVNMDEPYAAAIVEPSAASSGPVWPSKALVMPLFVLIGLVAGYVIYGFRKVL